MIVHHHLYFFLPNFWYTCCNILYYMWYTVWYTLYCICDPHMYGVLVMLVGFPWLLWEFYYLCENSLKSQGIHTDTFQKSHNPCESYQWTEKQYRLVWDFVTTNYKWPGVISLQTHMLLVWKQEWKFKLICSEIWVVSNQQMADFPQSNNLICCGIINIWQDNIISSSIRNTSTWSTAAHS